MKIQYRLVHGLTISSWHVIILLHLFDNLPFLYKLFLLFLFCFYFIFLSHRSIQTRLTFLLLFSLHNKYHTLHLPYDEIFLIFIRILEKKGYTTNNINRFSWYLIKYVSFIVCLFLTTPRRICEHKKNHKFLFKK